MFDAGEAIVLSAAWDVGARNAADVVGCEEALDRGVDGVEHCLTISAREVEDDVQTG